MEGGSLLDMRKDTVQLYDAAVSGDVATLHKLLQHDPLLLAESSLTSLCETPLHVASSLGHLDFTIALLARKPSLASEGDSLGRRPLHLASAEGHLDIVRELLAADADVCGVTDGDCRTPLHLAAMKGRVHVVRELVRARPGSVKLPRDGDSVVHLCVKYCQLEALVVLVDLMGDSVLNARDDEGNTVLHLAVHLTTFKTVKYLLSLGVVKANVNALNSNNCTPLDISEKCPRDFRSLQIQHLLMQVGAKRAKDITNLPPSTPPPPPPPPVLVLVPAQDSNIKKIFMKSKECLTEQVEWISHTHGNLMVVATVIATMSFQSVLSPPGGFHPHDSPTPGEAVFALHPDYKHFATSSKVSFVASITVTLLHFGGFPLKNKIGTWLITIAMCTAMWYLFQAYRQASKLVNEDELNVTYIIWKVALACVVLIHTVRLLYWLLSKLRPSSKLSLPLSIVLAIVTCAAIFVLGNTRRGLEPSY